MPRPARPSASPLILLLAIAPIPALAGAWVRDAGGLYLSVGPSLFVGEPSAGGLDDSPASTFTGRAVEAYGEIGIGAGLELDLSARWVANAQDLEDGTTRSVAGAGDIEARLKWGPPVLLQSGATVSFVAGARVAPYPTLSFEDEASGEPPLGPGGADLLVGANVGTGLSVFPGWIDVGLLHRVRLNSPSAALSLRGELGWRPWRPLALALAAEVQPAYGRRLDGPEDAPMPVPTQASLGAKVLVELAGGVGLAVDFAWQPGALSDGAGYRAAAGVTWSTD